MKSKPPQKGLCLRQRKPPDRVLLTAVQVAALLGITSRTFLSVRAEAWMPKPVLLTVGGKPRWVLAEVEQALKKHATRVDPLARAPRQKERLRAAGDGKVDRP